MDSLKTDFTKQFDVRLPIVCAPMFLVSSIKMVVSASEAGGVGTFPALNFRPIEKYCQVIKEIKTQTAKPFGSFKSPTNISMNRSSMRLMSGFP